MRNIDTQFNNINLDIEDPFGNNPNYYSFDESNENDFFPSYSNFNNSNNLDMSQGMNLTEESEDRREVNRIVNNNESQNNNISNNNSIKFKVEHSTDDSSSRDNNNKKSGLGRKRGSDKTKGQHDKHSDDNLRRIVKHIVLKHTQIFINKMIEKLCKGNIGSGRFKRQLLTLNKKQKSDATINYNQNFLNKTLGDIFSDDISSKYTNFNNTHNKEVIEALKNEEDENLKTYFRNLFNCTFVQCMKHFRGEEIFQELIGMKSLYEIKDELNEDEEYIKELEYYINNFEKIIMRKKSRASNKKKKK